MGSNLSVNLFSCTFFFSLIIMLEWAADGNSTSLIWCFCLIHFPIRFYYCIDLYVLNAYIEQNYIVTFIFLYQCMYGKIENLFPSCPKNFSKLLWYSLMPCLCRGGVLWKAHLLQVWSAFSESSSKCKTEASTQESLWKNWRVWAKKFKREKRGFFLNKLWTLLSWNTRTLWFSQCKCWDGHKYYYFCSWRCRG